MHDVIIVGGGAAGLSAATYALGKRLNFLIICEELGGKAAWNQRLEDQADDENRPGNEAVHMFQKQVGKRQGAIVTDRVTKVTRTGSTFEVQTGHHGTFQSTTVIIATGASPQRLDVPGSEELLGHGLGYSVTTYSQLLRGKHAAVIGNTERALRGVGELARTAERVYLVATDSAVLNTPLAQALRQRSNVEVLEGYQVVEVIGPRHVTELVVARGEKKRGLGVAAAFVDLGLRPNSDMVRGLAQTDREGFIEVDERCGTNVAGLFAAGDVTTSFGEQVLIAIGEGARAALSVYDYLLTQPEPLPETPVDVPLD